MDCGASTYIENSNNNNNNNINNRGRDITTGIAKEKEKGRTWEECGFLRRFLGNQAMIVEVL